MPRSRAVIPIGVPMDLGQARRGVDMGPAAVRYAGLHEKLRRIGCTVEDHGDIKVPVRDSLPTVGGLDYLPHVTSVCEAVYEAAHRAIAEGAVPLFLGGDHSIAAGTIGGVSHDASVGVVWVDAHGDFNTPETSPSGNVHGMPLAALLGRGDRRLVDAGRPGPKLRAQDVVMIAIRDLDIEERKALRTSGVQVFTMRDIDEKGIAQVARDALDHLHGHRRLHVSLDMDSLDPSSAPGVGTPVDGGLSYREAHLLMEILAETDKVCSADVVEINPILDHRNETARLAVELVASLFGERIF